MYAPTPFVQPNPICTVYSPPPPAASGSVALNCAISSAHVVEAACDLDHWIERNMFAIHLFKHDSCRSFLERSRRIQRLDRELLQQPLNATARRIP